MAVDPEDLRKYYASLGDEELEAIDRTELTDIAQKCYDDEFIRRGLDESQPAPPGYVLEEVADGDVAVSNDGEKPDWMDEAAEVYSQVIRPGSTPDLAAQARDVLKAAGIPCYLDVSEIEEDRSPQPAQHQWRVMVPGALNLRATSTLDRDMYNADFAAEWKTLLEGFSDAQLRAMNPRVVFCGLFDRIERVTMAYNQELARRKLAESK